MTGIEPRSSGIVSDRSANCATSTSNIKLLPCVKVETNKMIQKNWLFTLYLIIVIVKITSCGKTEPRILKRICISQVPNDTTKIHSLKLTT